MAWSAPRLMGRDGLPCYPCDRLRYGKAQADAGMLSPENRILLCSILYTLWVVMLDNA